MNLRVLGLTLFMIKCTSGVIILIAQKRGKTMLSNLVQD